MAHEQPKLFGVSSGKSGSGSKWRAQIQINGVKYYGNWFDDAAEAAHQYDLIAYKLRGPATALNFELPAAQRAELDDMTIGELMASFRAQGTRFARGSSKFRGVSWDTRDSKWQAKILNGAKYQSLGYFISEVEAALAYDTAARNIHGAAAKLNFPLGLPAANADVSGGAGGGGSGSGGGGDTGAVAVPTMSAAAGPSSGAAASGAAASLPQVVLSERVPETAAAGAEFSEPAEESLSGSGYDDEEYGSEISTTDEDEEGDSYSDESDGDESLSDEGDEGEDEQAGLLSGSASLDLTDEEELDFYYQPIGRKRRGAAAGEGMEEGNERVEEDEELAARRARHEAVREWARTLVGPEEALQLEKALLEMYGRGEFGEEWEAGGGIRADRLQRQDAPAAATAAAPLAGQPDNATGSKAYGKILKEENPIDIMRRTPVLDSLVAEYLGLSLNDEDRRQLLRDLPETTATRAAAAATAGRGTAAPASGAGGSLAGGDGGAGPSGGSGSGGGGGGGGSSSPVEPSLRLQEGAWHMCKKAQQGPEYRAESIWTQLPPDDVIWDKTLSPQLREQHARILDQLQKVMRGEPLTAEELKEIRDRAAMDVEEQPDARGETSPIAAATATVGATGRRRWRRRQRRYFPTASWPLHNPAPPGLWAPPPPEFLHFVAAGEMAAAGDVIPHVAKLLEAAGVDAATAAAAAAGDFSGLPPLNPGLSQAGVSAAVPLGGSTCSAAGAAAMSMAVAGPSSSSPAAAPAAGGADRYGYPISSYISDDILYRAAIETARLAGKPPPPPPNKYTFKNNRKGPRVGPGLMRKPLLTPPPWIANYKEQYKVAGYWTEELALDLKRLEGRDPDLKLRMEMPECLGTEAQLASGAMTQRDVPLSDSDSDCDQEGRPLPAGVPHTPMEWRAEGPGHVPAYRRALPPDPPLPPPTMTWCEAVHEAAARLGRPVPDPLPDPPPLQQPPLPPQPDLSPAAAAAMATAAAAAARDPQPVPHFSQAQMDFELDYDSRTVRLPRVRRGNSDEVDLAEFAFHIRQRSRPGAVLQL